MYHGFQDRPTWHGQTNSHCGRPPQKGEQTLIQIIGYALLALAAWLVYRGIKAPPAASRTAMPLMTLYTLLAFVIAIVGVGLVLGQGRAKISVSVYGTTDDAESYGAIVQELGRDYVVEAFDTYAKRTGQIEAVSCSGEALNAFIAQSSARTGIRLNKRLLEECPDGNSFTNFFHPHIAVYLR